MLGLEKDRRKYADHIWMFLIFLGWLISNLSDYLNEYIAIRSYYLLMAVAIAIVAFFSRKNGWFQKSFFEISICNIIDEILNLGDKTYPYELLIVSNIILYNFISEKRIVGK